MIESNQTNQEAVQEEAAKRTISTARLERIREAKNLSVVDFFKAMLSYEVANPSNDFQESITKFGETYGKNVSGGSKKNQDYDTISYLVSNGHYPIKGSLSKIQSSRKYDEPNIYLVAIQQTTGTIAKTTINMVNLNNITVEINGVFIGTIDSRNFPDIPLRSEEVQIVSQVSEDSHVPTDQGVDSAEEDDDDSEDFSAKSIFETEEVL